MQHRTEREAVQLEAHQSGVVGQGGHVKPDFATDAERAASVTPSLCPECGRGCGQDHARDCVLRPMPRYEDWLRELRAERVEDYWGKWVTYLTD